MGVCAFASSRSGVWRPTGAVPGRWRYESPFLTGPACRARRKGRSLPAVGRESEAAVRRNEEVAAQGRLAAPRRRTIRREHDRKAETQGGNGPSAAWPQLRPARHLTVERIAALAAARSSLPHSRSGCEPFPNEPLPHPAAATSDQVNARPPVRGECALARIGAE
jgi:hypothetical protein